MANDPWMEKGGPAFPCEAAEIQYKGMSLRDYFAAKAIQGLLANYEVTDRKGMASLCYEIADAMLKAREVQNG